MSVSSTSCVTVAGGTARSGFSAFAEPPKRPLESEGAGAVTM